MEKASTSSNPHTLMTQSIEGKAVLAVQEIIALASSIDAIDKSLGSIETITEDDMVYFTEKMLRLQQEFMSKAINGYVEVGYHYTSSRHIANIRQHGLLTRRDMNTNLLVDTASRHGTTFGDGVHTASNPDSFATYGDTGVLVARLPGKMVRVRKALPSNTKVNANTIVGDKMKSGTTSSQQVGKDNWPLTDANHECVLQSSRQCVPMIKYDESIRRTKKGKECIQKMEKGLLDIFDKYFNEGLQRTSYQDAEILSSSPSPPTWPKSASNPRWFEQALQQQQGGGGGGGFFHQCRRSGRSATTAPRAKKASPMLDKHGNLIDITMGKTVKAADTATFAQFNALQRGKLEDLLTSQAPVKTGTANKTAKLSSLQMTSSSSKQAAGDALRKAAKEAIAAGSATKFKQEQEAKAKAGSKKQAVSATTVLFPENSIPSKSTTLHYKAPKSLTTDISSDAMSTPDKYCNMKRDCSICWDALGNGNQCAMLKCRHIFHKTCIQRACQSKPECPECRVSIGAPAGKCPSGTMTITTTFARCSGFQEDSIVISYAIPSGKQKSYHDNPGTRHGLKNTSAYIPK